MSTQNSIDVFNITLSKWKVWSYACLCWAIACFPLLIALLFIWGLLTGKHDSTSSIILVIVICGAFFLLFAAIPFIFLTKLNKPVASLTRNEFLGLKNWKRQSFVWTPNTVTYYGNYGIMILANLDTTQSRASKFWGGPKEAVVILPLLVKQKRHDVLEAINRLSLYPVKKTTQWDMTKL